jgi:hypothetical protein
MSSSRNITRKSRQSAIDELLAKKVHCECIDIFFFYCFIRPTMLLNKIKSFEVNKTEIESLLTIYKHITRGQDRMDRFKFRDVLQNSFDMTDDFMMDKGVCVCVCLFFEFFEHFNIRLY